MEKSKAIRCPNCKERVVRATDSEARLYVRGVVLIKSAEVTVRCKCGESVDVTATFKNRHFMRLPKVVTA